MYKHHTILCGIVWIIGVLFFLSGCENKSEPPKAQVVRKKTTEVTDAREARVIPIDEVRDSIREEVRLARGRQLSLQRADAMSKAAAEGKKPNQ